MKKFEIGVGMLGVSVAVVYGTYILLTEKS
jgi:hypothetical protein